MNNTLPICEYREEIISKLKHNQVIIVCGDTGSGKTTQLPKMALEIGRGANGKRIACTQPRRLATVTVAERVAQEMKTQIGSIVGYQHRYAKEVTDETRIKFMTDGVLLAETRNDPLLRSYDTIIIDEAHERSLNVDFLLGILKRILSKRKDLKVIVSSATLDTEKFSKFFDNSPAIIVPGRLFPIDIIYKPPEDGEELDLPRDVARALSLIPSNNDTLVFLPGERDIRETADHLQRSPYYRNDAILPLLASLPSSEQKRAFSPSPKRRIILATNVAETSVTIPGIRAVIDSGLARISRYIHRTQIQRLQIEAISKASARQRAGRCGRLGPGTCIRLYSEEDFNSREDFTPPEILRSSLAGVILTMLDLHMGKIENFPFIDPPKPTMIREGLRELLELEAICHNEWGDVALTKIGRKLAVLPIEPRLAKIMLTASRLATLPSILPIISSMSCDDPKRRPVDEKEKADQAHAAFRVDGSDFLGTLKLWNWWDEESKTLSQTRLRQLATKNYISYPKMREWRELTRQLTELAKRLKLDIINDNGGNDALHRALVSGLLSRLGHLNTETMEYRGAHSLNFSLHPSSIISKRSKKNSLPEWIVAGELVDTSRLFAKNAATIDARWIEDLAGNLCKHSYRDPQWDSENGFVRATEQVSLYGLIIVPSRRRDFSKIDPLTSRKLFILHALVMGEFPSPIPQALKENLQLIREIRDRAERLRHPELFDATRLANHFDKILPKEIVSAKDLRYYLGNKECSKKFLLNKQEWLVGNYVSKEAFPNTIRIGDELLHLSYHHTPNDPERDGITCTVKKSNATMLRLWRHDWLVPGALPEKIMCILSSLPSSLRRILSPLNETVSVITPLLKIGDESLTDAIRRVINERYGIKIPSDALDNIKLPPHLLVRFRIRDDHSGEIISCSRNLETALREAGIKDSPLGASAGLKEDKEKHTQWDFAPLEESVTTSNSNWSNTYYQALRDEGDGVTIRLFKDKAVALATHENGIIRLMYLQIMRNLKNAKSDDSLWAAIKEVAVKDKPIIRDADSFAERLVSSRRAITEARAQHIQTIKRIEKEIREILWAAEALPSDIYDDIETQIAWLTPNGFAKTTSFEKLSRYETYFKALRLRIERAKVSPSSDRNKLAKFSPYWDIYVQTVTSKSAKIINRKALSEYRWMLEEYRISVFAQEIKTLFPISPKRLEIKWGEAVDLS